MGSAPVKRLEVSVSQSREKVPRVGARLGWDGLNSFQWGVTLLGVQLPQWAEQNAIQREIRPTRSAPDRGMIMGGPPILRLA